MDFCLSNWIQQNCPIGRENICTECHRILKPLTIQTHRLKMSIIKASQFVIMAHGLVIWTPGSNFLFKIEKNHSSTQFAKVWVFRLRNVLNRVVDISGIICIYQPHGLGQVIQPLFAWVSLTVKNGEERELATSMEYDNPSKSADLAQHQYNNPSKSADLAQHQYNNPSKSADLAQHQYMSVDFSSLGRMMQWQLCHILKI